MSSVGKTPTTQNHYFTRLSLKRKLEDRDSSHVCSRTDWDSSSSWKGKAAIDHDCESSSAAAGDRHAIRGAERRELKLPLQFFVRMMSGGETLVLRAKFEDTVEMVLQKIQDLTGIPELDQRLIYRGKQLVREQTLSECKIEKDSGLQLVARMRSTDQPWAWRVISDLVSLICRICKKELVSNDPILIQVKLEQFVGILKSTMPIKTGESNYNKMKVLPNLYHEGLVDYNSYKNINKRDCCRIFMDGSVPQGLMMLYMSNERQNQRCADQCIRSFVGFVKEMQGTERDRAGKAYCATMVLEFCRLLRRTVTEEDLLYIYCRSTLGSMMENVNVGSNGVATHDVFFFLYEIGEKLCNDLKLSVASKTVTGPSHQIVSDFSAFLQPLSDFIVREFKKAAGSKAKTNLFVDEAHHLLGIFSKLIDQMDNCLYHVELRLESMKKTNNKADSIGWAQYLPILKELHSLSLLYPGSEDRFWNTMRKHGTGVCRLVVKYAMRTDNHSWLSKHKEVLNFEARRHLALFLFPDMKEEYGELHEMLIDRSNLLAESFEYISGAKTSDLHSGLFMEFKNEEATGPGVLREWFCLVTQAIFDPRNSLFVSCPLDRRRFFPNAASKVDPLHLRYFRFAGRVIAMALMHKIQVGVVLDRVLFLQLARRHVSLEDIQSADPCIYNSCKQILEMDAAFVDSDGLGLTFVTEVEELGIRKAVELCIGGKDIAVNSRNRKSYVDLIVKHYFVKSIADQVSCFADGFSDILSESKDRDTFFELLKLEDFDWMLHGSESEICVEDWKSHTEYNGYIESDPQIVWFWEVVGQLSAEQKKTLLFFWTSVKYLPVEGFRGLASRVHIHKSFDSEDCLPSSHTCFYQICIPQYPSKAVMRERILFITQEHVSSSFGTP